MRTLSLFLLCCLLMTSVAAQSVRRIRLNPPKQRTTASRIQVTAVIDDREDTSSVGTIRTGLGNKLKTLSVEQGVTTAAQELLLRYQRPAAAAVPLAVHIRDLNLSETSKGGKQRLTITYSYAFVGQSGELSYEGSAYAESTMDVSAFAERLLRESLTNTFDKVSDAWKDPEPPATVKATIEVKIEPQPASAGLISYNPSRPLTFDDFQGVPDDLSEGSAATYTGISFAYSAQETGAGFRIIVSISAITDPAKSWMRPIGRNARVLAHENLHFALTAIVACRLADSLRQTVVTKADYDEKLRKVFNFFDRQQEQAQRQYDLESVHGTNTQQQAFWEQRVAVDLKRGCAGY